MARLTFARRSALTGFAVVGALGLAAGAVSVHAAPTDGQASYGSVNTYTLPPPAGQPFDWGHIPGMASGDGAVWATGGNQAAIGEITTPSGARVSPSVDVLPVNISNTRCLQLKTYDGPNGYCSDHIHSITVGPDGDIYFAVIHTGNFNTQGAPTRIIKMSPSGQILGDFADPGSKATGNYSAIVGMTSADGDVWYEQSSTDAGLEPGSTTVAGAVTAGIVRLASNGSQTVFPVAPGTNISCCYGGITPGPGGLYFGAQGGYNSTSGNYTQALIERMDYSGAVTGVWVVGPSSGQPTSIVLGPNGDLYFDWSGGIGRLDPGTGAVTTFPTANPPSGITVGGDGNIWFTEPATSTLVRMAPDGTPLATYPTSPLRSPVAMTTGSNGNVYFAERGSPATGGVVDEFVVCSGNAGQGVGNGNCDTSAAAGNR